MSILSDLYDAHVTIAGHPITWREIIGNAFGFASAVGGMRRRVWAWPVGIAGNVLLFSGFIAAAFEAGAPVAPFRPGGGPIFFFSPQGFRWGRPGGGPAP